MWILLEFDSDLNNFMSKIVWSKSESNKRKLSSVLYWVVAIGPFAASLTIRQSVMSSIWCTNMYNKKCMQFN